MLSVAYDPYTKSRIGHLLDVHQGRPLYCMRQPCALAVAANLGMRSTSSSSLQGRSACTQKSRDRNRAARGRGTRVSCRGCIEGSRSKWPLAMAAYKWPVSRAYFPLRRICRSRCIINWQDYGALRQINYCPGSGHDFFVCKFGQSKVQSRPPGNRNRPYPLSAIGHRDIARLA